MHALSAHICNQGKVRQVCFGIGRVCVCVCVQIN